MMHDSLGKSSRLIRSHTSITTECDINNNNFDSGLNTANDSTGNDCSSSNDNRILFQQVIELRRRLDDDHHSYKRKLQHYQDSQHKQAQLVSKLQQKVLQYKARCSELEMNVDSRNVELDRLRSHQEYLERSKNDQDLTNHEIETLMIKVEEEQQKLV
jgi:SMC interacting uncharacterized protein involved in chromosome segregation